MDPQLLTTLVALIAPLAALGGVLLGGRIQRNTTREQLKEQRRRDKLTWAREDRHRFAAERRVVYAEYLAASVKFEDLTTRLSIALHQDLEAEAHNSPPDVDMMRSAGDS